ncbi:ribbon-helix-helix protein, CopG family [Vibrio inusitatus]|nr:ribbon-helix-helix protein, CopG family [Vibrio inusitatus]
MSKPRITIRFEESLYKEIQDLAQREDRSINWIVNKLLRERIQRKKLESN